MPFFGVLQEYPFTFLSQNCCYTILPGFGHWGEGLLENEMINSGKPSAYYWISVSHSGFADNFYYQSCILKFFFTKTKKETISSQLNSINHEEKILEATRFL